MKARLPVGDERAQNGMEITREVFTLRMRTSHGSTASYRQSPIVWESVR